MRLPQVSRIPRHLLAAYPYHLTIHHLLTKFPAPSPTDLPASTRTRSQPDSRFFAQVVNGYLLSRKHRTASPYHTEPAQILQALEATYGMDWLIFLYNSAALPWCRLAQRTASSVASRKKKKNSHISTFDFTSWRCQYHTERFLPTVDRKGNTHPFLDADVLSVVWRSSDKNASPDSSIASTTGSLGNGSLIGRSIEDGASFDADMLSVLRTTSDVASTCSLSNASLTGSSIDGVLDADLLSVLRTTSDVASARSLSNASLTGSSIDGVLDADLLSVLRATSASTCSLHDGSLSTSSMDDRQIQSILRTMSEQHASGLPTSPSISPLPSIGHTLSEPSQAPSKPSPIGMEINLTADDV